MKKAVKIIDIVITVLLCIILLFNVIMLIQKKAGHKKYPTVLGYGAGVIISGSMTGTINVDDMVITKEQKDYHIGDIILFEEGSMLVTHRIVDRNDTGFITKGDANNSIDLKSVSQQAIYGKVVRILPKFGKVVQFLRSPLGLMLIVLVGFLLIFLPGLVQMKDAANSAKKAAVMDGDGSEKTVELNEGADKTIELTEGSEKTVELSEGSGRTEELTVTSSSVQEDAVNPPEDISVTEQKISIDELNQLIDDIENGR